MKNIALHWWILIGLFLGGIVGYFIAPQYELKPENLEQLKKVKMKLAIPDDMASTLDELLDTDIQQKLATQSLINPEVIQDLIPLAKEGKKFKNKMAFKAKIKEVIGASNTKLYFKHIEQVAKIEAIKVSNIRWLGTFFLNALKMIIVPLILSSIVAGVTSIGKGENLGRLGLKTLGYYLTTSLLAILTGLLLVNFIQPGLGAQLGFEQTPGRMLSNDFEWYSIFLNIVHPNFFEALTKGKMLSIIAFSIVIGVFILQVEDSYRETLKQFFDAIFAVMMKVTLLIIKLTPIGVFGIVVGVVADAVSNGTLQDIVGRLAWYSITVLLGLAIHAFIILPILMTLISKKIKPIRHLKNMLTPLLNAFGTASSSATLPLTMEAVEHKSGVSNKVTSFTIPLGATVNMDGTALYECVAAMFIAQAYGIDLSIGQQILVVVTALTASIGAAGIPGAGLVMMSVILTAVGLPLEGVGLVLAVDRILDMCRTAVNVWSDSCGAVIIADSEGEELEPLTA